PRPARPDPRSTVSPPPWPAAAAAPSPGRTPLGRHGAVPHRTEQAAEVAVERAGDVAAGGGVPELHRAGHALSVLDDRALRHRWRQHERAEQLLQLVEPEPVLGRTLAVPVDDETERLQFVVVLAALVLDRAQ